jgi:hypothetical protein
MPCASGHCVLTSIEGVQHLVEYFELTSRSCGRICATPFELKGVKCNKRLDLSNTNNTEFRLIEQHDIHKSAEIQNNNIAQRKNDLLAERKSILKKQRECMRILRKNESSEQREIRLAKIRSYKKQVGKVKGTNDESVEERNSRLVKQHEYMRARRKKSVEERNSRLEKQREYTRAYSKNKSSEQREKELSTHITVDITRLIRDFHNSISSGPLYVCTCCDQNSKTITLQHHGEGQWLHTVNIKLYN